MRYSGIRRTLPPYRNIGKQSTDAYLDNILLQALLNTCANQIEKNMGNFGYRANSAIRFLIASLFELANKTVVSPLRIDLGK